LACVSAGTALDERAHRLHLKRAALHITRHYVRLCFSDSVDFSAFNKPLLILKALRVQDQIFLTTGNNNPATSFHGFLQSSSHVYLLCESLGCKKRNQSDRAQ